MKKRTRTYKSPAKMGKPTDIEKTTVALVYELSCKGRSVKEACAEVNIDYSRLQYLVRTYPDLKSIKHKTIKRFQENKKHHAQAKRRFDRNIEWSSVNRQLDEWLRLRENKTT